MATPSVWQSAFDVNVGAGTTGAQTNPKIIGLSNGNILVAWEADGAGTTGSGNNADIIGKIYDAQGFLVRNEFQINVARNADNERDFDIAATNDGGFILAYMDDDTNNTNTALIWERFDDGGDRIDGATTIASENGSGDIRSPRIVVDQSDNSGFVTWELLESGGDLDIRGVHFDIDASGGATLGTAFDAGQNTPDFDRDHETALLITGELVVVYEEDDSGTQSMEIRIYDSAGTLQHFNLTSLPAGVSGNPQVAGLANGNFVVVWEDSGDVFGRIFNSAAGAVGSQFNVETGSDNVNEIRVVALPGPASGDFVVVWDDDTDDRTEMRQFNSDGTFDGSQVTAINNAGTNVDIGVTVDGRILVTHQSEAGEIDASIFDSRTATDIDAGDFSNEPLNFLSGTVVTGKQQGTDFDGNSLANTFFGQNGNDTIDGFGGNDTLNGAGGNDIIRGGSGQDSIRGGSGLDTIQGGLGNDTLVGDTGIDTVDYSYSNPPPISLIGSQWTITLGAGFNPGSAVFSTLLGPGETDQLFTFENVIGSGYRDVVDIRAEDNVTNNIQTGEGNDEVITSRLTTNNDTLNGGNGTDKLTVEGVFASVVIYDLDAEEARFNGLKTADIISFENIEIDGGEGIIGTDGANNIKVNDSFAPSNVIEGRGGNDTIEGGNGSDDIDAGAGDDLIIDEMDGGTSTIDGGLNIDTLDLSGAAAGVNADSADVTSRDMSNASVLELSRIENIITTDFADDVSENGTTGDFNGITLGGGDDTLRASANGSSDVFDGGAGVDTYIEDNNTSRVLNLETERGGSAFDPTRVELIDFENAEGNGGNDTITGTDADGNMLDGNGGSDELNGLSGNDTILGGGGSDTLNGNADNDSLDGGGNADTLNGGSGDDVLLGGNGSDALRGDSGADTIEGGSGEDSIEGGSGSDSIVGGVNNDTIEGGSGSDTIDGGDGSDSIDGCTSSDVLSGGSNGDTIDGGNGADTVSGNGGSDILRGGSGADSIEGGTGDDDIDGGTGDDTIEGGKGADTIEGGDDFDILSYASSSDVVMVNLDQGTASGGDAGGDIITGIEGLIGSEFGDVLTGQGGSQSIAGGGGADTIDGGSGDDTLNGDNGADVILGGNSNDLIDGGSGGDDIDGGSGSDTIDGGSGADTIAGGGGGDVIDGGTNADSILGNGGDDSIVGGNGADTMDGGTGADTLEGGDGADVFVFALNAGNDIVLDFEDGLDQLDFSAFGLGNAGDLRAAGADLGSDYLIDLGNIGGTGLVLIENWSESEVNNSDLIL